MTAARAPRKRPSPRKAAERARYKPVHDQLNDELTKGREPGAAHVTHLAALLAWAPQPMRSATKLSYRFEAGQAAIWAQRAMVPLPVEASIDKLGVGYLHIDNPTLTLGRFGFRDPQWVFETNKQGVWGMVRGALHSAGRFDSRGLHIESPSNALALRLTVALARLGVEAAVISRISVRIQADDVAALLGLLALPRTAAAWTQVRASRPTSEALNIHLQKNSDAIAERRGGDRVERLNSLIADETVLDQLAPELAQIVRLQLANPRMKSRALGELTTPPTPPLVVSGQLRKAEELLRRLQQEQS